MLRGFFQVSTEQTEHLLPSPHIPVSDLLPTRKLIYFPLFELPYACSFHSDHSQAIPQNLWVKSKLYTYMQEPPGESHLEKQRRKSLRDAAHVAERVA